MNTTMTEKSTALLNALSECANACNHCSTACLDEEDVKMMAECIRLDMDCAAICSVAAGFVARGSVNAQDVLEVCASICARCADECEKHAHMQHCADCASACRACEEACKAA